MAGIARVAMERRDFLVSMAGASIMALGNQSVLAAEKPSELVVSGRIFEIEHKMIPLPFDPAKLEGLSEKLMKSHWENNYASTIKNMNTSRKKLSEALANKDTPPFVLNGIKREHLMRTGSIVLHESYFGNLGGRGTCSTALKKKITSDFGSMETWESEFRKIGLGLGGGSGWVIMGYNFYLKTIENYWLADHMHFPAATVPLLVMDMYEHSYQMDYGASATAYIDAFFKNIKWEIVEGRLEKAVAIKWS